MPYDLFISYSRRDNVNNRVTELKTQIEADYLEFTKEPLNCFFDQEEIKGMDDWQFRLLQGLKDSHLLLVILSPNYLASPYCEWEIVEYLKYEYSRGVAGDGVAQVYFMEIPGIDDEGFRAKAAQWLEKVSRRQRIDLRPWRDEGADSLKRKDVKKRLEELKESLRKRITRMRVISEVPGNLPAPNPRFVGREREMEMLHKATALGQLGVITAVHGVGGLGKTAIAFQYAYTYANFYPGGRWYLGCANETSLASVIKRLDADLNVTLTEDEKKDDVRGAKRILNELFNMAVENAEKANKKSNVTSSDKEYSKPAVLLILDNVDHPELIQSPCSDIISGKEWLKVLATTRLGPEELGEDETTQKLLSIDELPIDDGVSLIESYQPGGRYRNSEEKEKAGEIVKLVGGFTLAVEVAALYLYERKGRVSCAEFLDVLKSKGVDYVGEHTNKQLSHTKLISATLTPTLDTLSLEESLILSYASHLPPDSIPLPWLKVLVVNEYPQMGEEEMAGIDNPWISTINHLMSLRLLQIVDLDGQVPRLVRLPRLIQNEIKSRNSFNSNLQLKIVQFIKNKCESLYNSGWTFSDNHWEIWPLSFFAETLTDLGDENTLWILNDIAKKLYVFGHYTASEPLFEKVRLEKERTVGVNNVDTLNICGFLANIKLLQGIYNEAEFMFHNILDIQISLLGRENEQTILTFISLAQSKFGMGAYDEAEEILRQELIISERVLGIKHSNTILCLQILSQVLLEKGNPQEANLLLKKIIEASISALGKDNEEAIEKLRLCSDGDIIALEWIINKSIENIKKIFGAEHPFILTLTSSLVEIKMFENPEEADLLNSHLIDLAKKTYGLEHPLTLKFLLGKAVLMRINDKEPNEIRKLLEQVLNGFENILTPCHPNILVVVNMLTDILIEEADYLAVKKLFEHEINIADIAFGNENQFSKELKADLDKSIRQIDNDLNDPIRLRNLALEYYRLGDYDRADEILKRSLITGSESVGTYHHLARICLITDRFTEAEKHVQEAWKIKHEAKPYIVTRLLWFKITLAFLENKPLENYFGQLKSVLLKEDAFMEWTMQPVLDHIKSQITESQYALLSALVAAMSDKQNLEKLNEFEEWKNSKPEEIEW